MDALETFRRLWDHAAWADELLLSELTAMQPPPALAWREYSHVLGAESVWLDRLLRRPARYAVWPELSVAEASSLAGSLRAEYSAYVAALSPDALDARVPYVNSAGQSFVRNVIQALLGPIDWIFIFGERRQRLGDKAAGTIVIVD